MSDYLNKSIKNALRSSKPTENRLTVVAFVSQKNNTRDINSGFLQQLSTGLQPHRGFYDFINRGKSRLYRQLEKRISNKKGRNFY